MGNRTVALLAAGALMSLSSMLAIAPAHAVDVDPGPIIESVGAAPQPVEVGSIMTATARFTDLNTGPHTAQLGWGDGTTSVGTVTQSGADGTVTGQHTYQVSGWYHLSVYVANDQSESDQEVFNYSATAYQPSKKDKFVGGKSFITPAHTFVDDQYNNYPATFDFAYQYDGDQPVAKKTFTLDVPAKGLHFASTAVRSLMFAETPAYNQGTAYVHGTGTVNGGGEFDFWISGRADMLAISITDATTGSNFFNTQRGIPEWFSPLTRAQGKVTVKM